MKKGVLKLPTLCLQRGKDRYFPFGGLGLSLPKRITVVLTWGEGKDVGKSLRDF